MSAYKINELVLGEPSHSGHETYQNARDSLNRHIIYKKNKFGMPFLSLLEASFSQLAKLFLSPGLTSSLRLVVDEEKNITGLAVQHLCYVIEDKVGLADPFYMLCDPKIDCSMKRCIVSDSTQIPFYFFDKLPQGFYKKLLKQQKQGMLTIDYDSLASILTLSYTLEEDDLHKGNFGFYLTQKNGKPHVVFFKIDHDLMFVDSIMGFQTRRPFHLLHGADAFNISTDDLVAFPNLKKSSNAYWPTKFCYIENPFDNKGYCSFTEITAFVQLADNAEFVKAKWRNFYKHILIPPQLIEQALAEVISIENETERAHQALVMQALVARLAHLRAALFSTKEFRQFIGSLDEGERQALLHEVTGNNDEVGDPIQNYFDKLSSNEIIEGDTPLHTAIKLGEYRYEETWRMFGSFLNTKNSAGQTPLDVALNLTVSSDIPNKVSNDKYFIMKHLLEKGAEKTSSVTPEIENKIKTYKFENSYLKEITSATDYNKLKKSLRDIGENHHFCLKYKKNLALECIHHWIGVRKNSADFPKELKSLKKAVNGKTTREYSPGLNYLRQLRSKLWIVRQIRGLYGLTSTQKEINHIINKALSTYQSKKQGTLFFSPKEQMSQLRQQTEVLITHSAKI